MNVKNLKISEIKIYKNTRTTESDVSGLMTSIEQDGLQHPIGVYKKDNEYILSYGYRRLQAHKKLGYKQIPAIILEEKFSEDDFLIKNTIENIHRKDLSVIELGKTCQEFINKGYTKSEISSKLHIQNSRVSTAIQMFNFVPKKYQDFIGFLPRGELRNGRIPPNVAIHIINMHLGLKQTESLFELAKTEELSTRQISFLSRSIKTGITFEQALKNLKKCTIRDIYVLLDIKELEKLNLPERSFNKYFHKVITKEIPINEKLFIG